MGEKGGGEQQDTDGWTRIRKTDEGNEGPSWRGRGGMRGQKEGEQGRVGKNVNSQWGRCWRKSRVDGNVSDGSESE